MLSTIIALADDNQPTELLGEVKRHHLAQAAAVRRRRRRDEPKRGVASDSISRRRSLLAGALVGLA